METGKVCPSTHKRLAKFLNSRSYIFATLKDQTLKLCLFTNFKVLFPAVSIVLRYQAYIKNSNFRKGLLTANRCEQYLGVTIDVKQ